MTAQDRARRIEAPDLALLALLTVLTGTTSLVALDAGIPAAIVDPELDVLVLTISTLVAGSLTALLWVRYREGDPTAALVRASAFAVLLAGNLPALLVTLLDEPMLLGMSLENPGQLPILLGTAGRSVAAALLVLAGAVALRPETGRPQMPVLLLIGPAALVLLLLAVAAQFQDRLPMLLSPDGIAQLRNRPELPLFGPTLAPGVLFLQLLTAAGYLVAAGLSWRAFHQAGRTFEALLAVGLVLAAYSQVHFALNPATYTDLVSVGDGLRVGFYTVLLFALVAESRADVRAIRLANADLRRLRDAELAGVTLEERARLAREIHDGLAQDLWYAKLKQGRLASLLPEGNEARVLAGEVVTALDSAIVEARQAVMALRSRPGAGSLEEVLSRYVEDFGDRFALRTEFSASAPIPALTPRVQAEVLRIVQEALNNVRKHADATIVRVFADVDDHHASFEIVDNGRGFNPSSVSQDRYGLTSMRERAEVIGGRVSVAAGASGGTRVTLEVPVGEEAR